MKYLFFFITAFIFLSCNHPEKKIIPLKIDKTLTELFKKKFANYEENELIKEKALKEFEKKMDSLIPLNYIDDIPVKLFYVKKNEHGKGALAFFYTDDLKIEYTRISDKLRFNLIAFVEENKADSLIQNSSYYVKGKNYKLLSKTEAEIITDRFYYSNEFELNNKYDPTFFQCGSIICVAEDLKITQ